METQTHAFPSDPAGYQPQQGLTKREIYSLIALHGFVSSGGRGNPETLAGAAVLLADALISVLKENEE